MKKTIRINSIDETRGLGKKLGELCFENCVITLSGDLGAGKTTFTQGLAKGLEIKKTVSSPTFTILKIYQGRLPLYHFDAYRLEGSDEDLGFEEMIDGDGVAVIEWPQYMEREIPEERLEIIIHRLNEDERDFELISYGRQYDLLGGISMITLCMDTSHRYLTLAVIKDNQVMGSFQKECFKRQSETILEELDALCKKIGLTNDQIESVCITKGPGSYTGVRIAMTIAKVFCTQRNIPLYTLSTLRLFSCGNPNCRVLLDARGKRAYTAVYQDGNLVGEETVINLDSLSEDELGNCTIMGDPFLVGQEMEEQDYALSFLVNQSYWNLQENPHTCVPEYLKDSNAYLVK